MTHPPTLVTGGYWGTTDETKPMGFGKGSFTIKLGGPISFPLLRFADPLDDEDDDLDEDEEEEEDTDVFGQR